MLILSLATNDSNFKNPICLILIILIELEGVYQKFNIDYDLIN